ncbi:hypothetical protein SAMN05444483_101334 [Salegentibacter echinorum]|uniref:Uncharacterized protein n=2 Tax=Salegentibacter echinorum TaxID=1073325 RepID=A0A1M5C4J5_SALEC|nr:hypothetical protein SAMN05444483_101334 [Salegentibacter echinorum]
MYLKLLISESVKMAKKEDIRKLEENWKSLHQEDRDREEQESLQNSKTKQKDGLKDSNKKFRNKIQDDKKLKSRS